MYGGSTSMPRDLADPSGMPPLPANGSIILGSVVAIVIPRVRFAELVREPD